MLFAIVAAALGGWFSILCLSVFAHRSMAHRAVTLHPVVAHVMRFWLWFSTGTATRRWVAVHRKHHVYTDSELDPHSPVIYGLPRVFFGGYWLYRRESLKPETIAQYGKDCPEDWIERNVYEKHDNLGLLAMLVLDIAVFGIVPGLDRVRDPDHLGQRVGRRLHQRRRSRARLSQLGHPGSEPQHHADRDHLQRRRAAQQPPSLAALREVLDALVRVRPRLGAAAHALRGRHGERYLRQEQALEADEGARADGRRRSTPSSPSPKSLASRRPARAASRTARPAAS